MLARFVSVLRDKRRELRQVGLGIAILIFIVGFFLAIRNAPHEILHLRLPILAAYAIFLPPITYLIQSVELRLSAKAVGITLTRKQAIEIVVYSNASTLLPIPGGLLTRAAALRANGVTVVRSASVVILFTGIAGSISFAYSGAWVLFQQPLLGLAAFTTALLGAAICFKLSRKLDVPRAILSKDVALRIFTVLFETGCFIVIFAAIGASITVQQAAFLVVSGFIAMALTIFPSGFGIREAIVALLSPLVGVDPATAFLAAAAGRIVGLLWMAALGIVILVTGTAQEGAAEQ
ncbi:MAG TPA: lysylphosphatidylglycerol synthase domain-containing protein [Sphingomicrobium sp.]|nr:lysylphosphatidylglycerol synthase domain-containing protein [Sphingomicrobium sp.]